MPFNPFQPLLQSEQIFEKFAFVFIEPALDIYYFVYKCKRTRDHIGTLKQLKTSLPKKGNTWTFQSATNPWDEIFQQYATCVLDELEAKFDGEKTEFPLFKLTPIKGKLKDIVYIELIETAFHILQSSLSMIHKLNLLRLDVLKETNDYLVSVNEFVHENKEVANELLLNLEQVPEATLTPADLKKGFIPAKTQAAVRRIRAEKQNLQGELAAISGDLSATIQAVMTAKSNQETEASPSEQLRLAEQNLKEVMRIKRGVETQLLEYATTMRSMPVSAEEQNRALRYKMQHLRFWRNMVKELPKTPFIVTDESLEHPWLIANAKIYLMFSENLANILNFLPTSLKFIEDLTHYSQQFDKTYHISEEYMSKASTLFNQLPETMLCKLVEASQAAQAVSRQKRECKVFSESTYAKNMISWKVKFQQTIEFTGPSQVLRWLHAKDNFNQQIVYLQEVLTIFVKNITLALSCNFRSIYDAYRQGTTSNDERFIQVKAILDQCEMLLKCTGKLRSLQIQESEEEKNTFIEMMYRLVGFDIGYQHYQQPTHPQTQEQRIAHRTTATAVDTTVVILNCLSENGVLARLTTLRDQTKELTKTFQYQQYDVGTSKLYKEDSSIKTCEYMEREREFCLAVRERIEEIMLEFVTIYGTAEAIAHHAPMRSVVATGGVYAPAAI